MMAGPSHPRVIVEIRSLTHGGTTEPPTDVPRATSTASCEPMMPVGPANHRSRSGLRRSPEAVGSAGHHGGRIARREHERVPGELDARASRRDSSGSHTSTATVDRRKRPVRGGDQRCVERMHGHEITVGQCASMS